MFDALGFLASIATPPLPIRFPFIAPGIPISKGQTECRVVAYPTRTPNLALFVVFAHGYDGNGAPVADPLVSWVAHVPPPIFAHLLLRAQTLHPVQAPLQGPQGPR